LLYQLNKTPKMEDIEEDVVSILRPIRTSAVRCRTNPIGSHDWREEGGAWNPTIWGPISHLEVEGMPERRPFRRSHISDGSREELAPALVIQHQQMGAHSLESQELLHESEGPGLIRLDARGLGQGSADMGSRPLLSPASAFQPVFMQTRNSHTLRREASIAVDQQRTQSLRPEGRDTRNRISRKGGCSIRRELWTDEALHAAI
jgi:hypothetical protein